MEAIARLLTLVGALAFWVALVSTIYPLKHIGLPTRKRSALALLLSLVVITIGVAMTQETPEEAAERQAESNREQAESEAAQAERERAEQEAARQAELARTIEVNASDLVREFKANEIRAEQKYSGKVVHITGVVDTIGEDIMGDGYVSFRGPGFLQNAQAMFDDKSVLAALNPGQALTVTCGDLSGGNIMGVILRQCAMD